MPMALPTAISSEGLANVIRKLEEVYRGREDFLRLSVMADIFYETAKEGKLTGNLAPFAVEQWLKAAKATCETALVAYNEQTALHPGFAEGLEERIREVNQLLGFVTPTGSQQRYRLEAMNPETALQPQTLPVPEPARRTQVTVMDR